MKNKNKIAIFLAARSGSQRLPGKHFLNINLDLKIIDLCILRIKKAKLVKKIFLCTTKKKKDLRFKEICIKHDINFFIGNEKNVLKRLIDCARENSIKTIVRITGDCPIIDPELVDKCIELHFKRKTDYTTNTLQLSFPDGLDVEVINLSALIKSQKISNTLHNREHVTPFIRESKLFKKRNYKNSLDYSNRRWTLDNFKDYRYLKKVVKYFSPNIYFSWKELIKAEKLEKSLINIKKR
jgi:spore coat polysaccharide biosynthesis protein SpsF (cytidylyltransferase family)